MKKGFYRKLDEIYGVAINNELSNKENRCFNSYDEIIKWMDENREQIHSFCKKNENVKMAFNQIKHSSMAKLKTALPKLEEISEYIRNRETMTNINDSIVIFDNRINNWIRINNEKLELLKKLGNSDAKLILDTKEKYLKQKKEKKYARLEKVYEYLTEERATLRSENQQKFEDGVDIVGWIYGSLPYLKRTLNDPECPQEIKYKVECIMKKVTDKEGKRISWADSNFNRKIDELYQYTKKYDNIPRRRSRETFKDGTIIGIWINEKYDKIKESALNGDEKANEIFKQIKKRGIKDKIMVEEHLEEMKNIIETTNELPSMKNQQKFTNGVLMYSWYRCNIEEIEKLIKTNETAKFVYEKMSNIRHKKFDNKLRELEEYYNINKKLPTKASKAIFSDNSYMYLWMLNNRDYIKSVGENGNEFAKELTETLENRKKSKNLSFDEKIKEAIQAVDEGKKLSSPKARFSYGYPMASFIYTNYEKIYELSKTNPELKKIINNYDRDKKEIKIERVESIYNDYKNNKEITEDDKKWIKLNIRNIEKFIALGNKKAEVVLMIYTLSKRDNYKDFINKKKEFETISKENRKNHKHKMRKISNKKYTLIRKK